jgi:glucose uptake protein
LDNACFIIKSTNTKTIAMLIVESYSSAVIMCVITMICWGSWANTMKLTRKGWVFQLYYWDYSIGVVLFSLLLAFTFGSTGTDGRSFINDITQASLKNIGSALLSGIIFNLSNVLLVTVIEIAGMAIAFPIGVGLALVIGVISGFITNPVGNPFILFGGLASVIVAIVIDGIAYSKIPVDGKKSLIRGIVISIFTGTFMGFFYPILVSSISANLITPETGKLTPYTAIVLFSVGLFLSSFIWDYYLMKKPVTGRAVSFSDYFKTGTVRDHLLGIGGGLVWCTGFSLMTLAGHQAGTAISYGLGQGATMIAAFWGVFVWKEFKSAPKSVNKLLLAMFLFYFLGLSLLIVAKS